MLVSNSGPDAASRAAVRLLMQRLPGLSPVEGGASAEPIAPTDPPVLRAAQIVEGSAVRAVKVSASRATTSGFGAFLDGAQKVQVVAHDRGMPIVIGAVSAAVRVRVNRRMITWGHQAPRVERAIYTPALSPNLDRGRLEYCCSPVEVADRRHIHRRQKR